MDYSKNSCCKSQKDTSAQETSIRISESDSMVSSSRRRPFHLIGSFFLLAAGPLLSASCFEFSFIPSKLASRKRIRLFENTLVPEGNPEANPNLESRSGVRYGDVLSGLNELFVPLELDKRNAVSRSDGYWPYINDESGPPQEFTYGEFDFFFFAELLDKAHAYISDDQSHSSEALSGKTFVDIGSGMGRLVFAAAALHPNWKVCRGIELLQGLHNAAEEILEQCRLIKEPKEEVPDPPKRNELWIPSLHSAGNTFRAGLPDFQTTNEEEWLSDLQRQFLEEKNEEFEGDSESDESSCDSMNGIPEDMGTESTSLVDYMGDSERAVEAEEIDPCPQYGLSLPPDNATSEDEPQSLPIALIEFDCGSFEDPFINFSDADIIFVFSSAFPKYVMDNLSRSIGTKCKPGTIVVTVDYMLHLESVIGPSISADYGFNLPAGRYKLQLLESVDGWCWLTGGLSTAFIHRVEVSLWEQQKQLKGPTLQDRAFQAVKAAEAEKLASAQRFLSGVYNNMVFHGLPESWRPKI